MSKEIIKKEHFNLLNLLRKEAVFFDFVDIIYDVIQDYKKEHYEFLETYAKLEKTKNNKEKKELLKKVIKHIKELYEFELDFWEEFREFEYKKERLRIL